ncbi:MAG: hypothetical protein GQ582_05375, partial [Methyloprofundus sp.]|nr:hypothetical protein [Methyloprofundus sp.]
MNINKKSAFNFFLFIVLSFLLNACDDSNTAPPLVAKQTQASAPVPVSAIPLIPAKQYATIGFKVLAITEHSYENKLALRVSLSVPIDASSDFNQYLSVSDKQGQPVDGHWILAAQGKQLFFTGIEPEHHYKVVVFKGLTAITDKYL